VTGQKDLLDALLERQDKQAEDAMSDTDIIHNFVTFFAGGMDTTGHTATMMLYHICQNRVLYDKVKEEVDQFYKGKGTNDLTIEDLASMEFTSLCLKETLRITPPNYTIFIREAISDHNLGDFKIKKGTLLATGSLWNNYNPKYHEDPERFDPYRWKDGKSKNIDAFAYTPFSGGQRNCIGQHMANISMKIIISEFLLRYDCKISEGYVHKMTLRFLNEPLNPLIVDLKKRRH